MCRPLAFVFGSLKPVVHTTGNGCIGRWPEEQKYSFSLALKRKKNFANEFCHQCATKFPEEPLSKGMKFWHVTYIDHDKRYMPAETVALVGWILIGLVGVFSFAILHLIG